MFKALTYKFVFIILCGSSSLSLGQTFLLTSDIFLPLYSGTIKWADLDNDNDLDIIYSGFTEGASDFFIKIYENNNGSFISRSTDLPNIRNGSFALGDFDNDGDLDILLSGLSNTGNISELHENNGSFLFSLKQSFPGLINTSVSWFDIDNDKDLDFLIAGVDDNADGPNPFVNKILVYENVNGNFNLLTGTNLPPCAQCSMDWADSNSDGKIDLLITGYGEDDKGHTDLYLNNGDKTFTKDQNSNLKDVSNGDVKWGDFDNDGNMDALVSGVTNDGNMITTVYRNTGGILIEASNIQLHPTGENWMSATSWVDYNNDGLLDILISGRGTSILVIEYIFKLYKNNGDGTFYEVSDVNFGGISDSSIDFGDFDNDGDVDFCFSGMSPSGPKTGIYQNKIFDETHRSNSKPTSPSMNGLSESFFRKQVKLNWSTGTDQETPAPGLSYNFYLKYGTSNIVAPTSNFNSGYVQTTNPHNGHSRISIWNNIPEGDYSWAVQSVDGGKLGSTFSPEKYFYQINGPDALKAEIIDETNIQLSWQDNSAVEVYYQLDRSTNPIADFLPLANLPPNTGFYRDNFAFLTDTYYYYRIYAVNAIKASAYDSLIALIPTAPENLLTQPINVSKITLEWEDLSKYEIGYEVQRKLSSEADFQTIALLASNTETFIDTELSEGTRYDYRVRAIVKNGSSAFSNTSSSQTNFRPLGKNFEKQTLEDESIYFAVDDFTDSFSDPDVFDQLVEINVVALPSKGTIKLNENPVLTGQIIPQIDLKNLLFIPLPNENGLSEFSFYNNDGKDNSISSYTVMLTITPVNDSPAFSIPKNVEVDEDFSIPVKITPVPALVPEDELSQVVVYSIQPTTSDKVTIHLNPDNGEINLTSVLNEFGEVEFILTANDGQSAYNTFSDTLKLIINPVNDAPVLSSIPDLQVEYLSVISPITFNVTDVDNPITAIIVTATSDNENIIKNDNITIQGDGQEKSILLLPEEALGETLITLTANDGQASVTVQFKLEIFSVTGISKLTNSSVKIFPNPFTSFINITLEEITGDRNEAILFNLLGQEISRQTLTTHESTFSFKEIPVGIYIFSIIGVNGDIVFWSKLLKN